MAINMKYGAEDGGFLPSGGLPSGGGANQRPVLLWTNPAPSASFAAQTVAVNLTGFTFAIILYAYTTGSQYLNSCLCPVGEDFILMIGNNENNRIGTRTGTAGESGVEFSRCVYNNATYNTGVIPYKIYGW